MLLKFIDDVDSPQFGVKRPDNRNPVSNRVVPTTTTERPGKTDDYHIYMILYDYPKRKITISIFK